MIVCIVIDEMEIQAVPAPRGVGSGLHHSRGVSFDTRLEAQPPQSVAGHENGRSGVGKNGHPKRRGAEQRRDEKHARS